MLRRLRINYRMSQQQLADKAGCSRSHIAMIESGRTSPSIKLAKRLGQILRVDWTRLV